MSIGQWLFIVFILLLISILTGKALKKSRTSMSQGKPVDFAIHGKLPEDDDDVG